MSPAGVRTVLLAPGKPPSLRADAGQAARLSKGLARIAGLQTFVASGRRTVALQLDARSALSPLRKLWLVAAGETVDGAAGSSWVWEGGEREDGC